jgi:isoamylase
VLHGDEMGRTQGGNNNVYCQDNETSWLDWGSVDEDLLAFTQTLTQLRAEHPVFRRRRFFTGEPAANGLPDIAWLSAEGAHMSEEDWTQPTVRALTVFLNGQGIAEPGPRGEAIADDSFLMILNPTHEDVAVTVPPEEFGEAWDVVLTTGAPADERRAAGEQIQVGARSLVVLRHE